jgi:chitinase
MWSINRDSQCGASFAEIDVHSNTCSGSAQSRLEFAHIFSELQGSVTASPDADGIQLAVADTNPADAPFPQWAPNASYPRGYKVVEAGEIYQALWYNNGQDPAAQQGMSQGPWELVGPVLPGDHGPHIARLRRGTYPAWSLGAQYQADDKVLYEGLPYRAKWSNQGISPASQSTDPSGSPWEALFGIPGEPAGAPALGLLPAS